MSSTLAAAVVAAAGVALTIATGPDYLRAWRSRLWPKHRATILNSSLVIGSMGSKAGTRLAGHGVVRYTYSVPDRFAAQPHLREGYRFRFGSMSFASASDLVRVFPEGAVVPVAVNPRNIDESVLIPGPSALATLEFCGSLLVLCLGIAWLIHGLALTHTPLS